MLTFLDLLIIVSMVLVAASFLSLVLMFLVRNKKIQHVCFYISVALSLYIAYAGIQINWPGFFGQAVLAAVLALVSIGALILERVKKGNDRVFLYARIAASAALVIGAVNTLLI